MSDNPIGDSPHGCRRHHNTAHDQENGRTFIGTMHCNHGEPYACLSDLLSWLNKLETDQLTGDALREFIVREFSLMGFSADMEHYGDSN